MDRQQLAGAVLDALHEGIVPWRFPNNVLPELKPLFGQFFTGEPQDKADYSDLDAILTATGARIVHHHRVVKPRCERPPHERILLPPRSRFLNERTYHATRIHEALHFLEQPQRVGWVGSDHQAELVAEIGTSFLESFLKLVPDQDDKNCMKWLPKWAEGIKANPSYLFDAVAQAERAVNYLLNLRRHKEAA